MESSSLTYRRRRFVEAYVESGKWKPSREAGYSERSAHTTAWRLLNDVEVRQAIESERQSSRARRTRRTGPGSASGRVALALQRSPLERCVQRSGALSRDGGADDRTRRACGARVSSATRAKASGRAPASASTGEVSLTPTYQIQQSSGITPVRVRLPRSAPAFRSRLERAVNCSPGDRTGRPCPRSRVRGFGRTRSTCHGPA